MTFKGTVHTREIERAPLEVSATQADAWVVALLEKAAPSKDVVGMNAQEWAKKSTCKLGLKLEKISSEYLLSATGDLKVPTGCSRCADPFLVDRHFDVKSVMLPRAYLEKDFEVDGDPDYTVLESEVIDIIDVLAEHLIVLEPVAECPPRKQDGTCTLCNKNPQFGSLESDTDNKGEENLKISPFSALASLKDKLKK